MTGKILQTALAYFPGDSRRIYFPHPRASLLIFEPATCLWISICKFLFMLPAFPSVFAERFLSSHPLLVWSASCLSYDGWPMLIGEGRVAACLLTCYGGMYEAGLACIRFHGFTCMDLIRTVDIVVYTRDVIHVSCCCTVLCRKRRLVRYAFLGLTHLWRRRRITLTVRRVWVCMAAKPGLSR